MLSFALSEGSGITLTNNEIKDMIKVIKSLERKFWRNWKYCKNYLSRRRLLKFS